MAKRLTSVLGIDVGSQYIKVCEIKSQGRDPVITALGLVPTPDGSVDHTAVYNSDAVGTALKSCLGDAGATVPYAVVSIAGQASVLVRTLEVPRMNPAELKEHMQWEINRNIPFAESTVVSDFKPLSDDDPNSPNMDVVMAIAPQSAIDTMIACVKKAGRTAVAIDVEPMSMARSIQTSYDDELLTKTICMVDMGNKTTSINIFRGAKLLMPRQIPIGGEMFTKAIADALTISNSEAEEKKLNDLVIPENAASAPSASPFGAGDATEQFQPYNPFSDEPMPGITPAPQGGEEVTDQTTGVPVEPPVPSDVPSPTLPEPVSASSTKLFNAIAPILDEFVAEIRRSIDYFKSRGGEIDLVLLCGGGTKTPGMSSFLAKTLGVPCDQYDPLRRLNVNARKIDSDFLDKHKTEFAIAVGNALHIFFD